MSLPKLLVYHREQSQRYLREVVRRAYPTLELDPDVLVRRQKEKTVICYVCDEMDVQSLQTPFVLSRYASLIILYPEC